MQYRVLAVNPRRPAGASLRNVYASYRKPNCGCRWSPHLRTNPTDNDNPSPDVLGPEARALWDATHANADRYYKGAWEMPKMTAWRAVKMRYPNGDGHWNPNDGLLSRLLRNDGKRPGYALPEQTFKMPDPGKTIVLGRALEYVTIENPPGMDVYRFADEERAPKLLWSPRQKALYIFPETEIPDDLNPSLKGLESEASLYRDWSWGQEPRGHAPFQVEDWVMEPLGMSDTIVYRSGKGTQVRDDPKGVQEYVHQHGDEVVTYVSKARSKNGTPKAIMIQGGELDVLEPGIVN